MRKQLLFTALYIPFYFVTGCSSYVRILTGQQAGNFNAQEVVISWLCNCILYFPASYLTYLSLQWLFKTRWWLPLLPVIMLFTYTLRIGATRLLSQLTGFKTIPVSDSYALCIALCCYGLLYFFIQQVHRKQLIVNKLNTNIITIETAVLKNTLQRQVMTQNVQAIEALISNHPDEALTAIEDLCDGLRTAIYNNTSENSFHANNPMPDS